MRLTAMAELHHNHLSDNRIEGLTPDQYVALLTDHQWEDLQNRKIKRLITQATFKQGATLTDINYSHNRNLDRNMFERLATLDFIQKKKNLIVTGSSVVGKSYIAQALRHQVCMMNKRTLYTNTARLMKRLKLSSRSLKTDYLFVYQ
ncbi:ATP-binding protein [Formosa haliotis]|uniref:ATP-binding protein n=1 Tax=Formosa haliotis TaxID=1555194 RepID=UPI001F17DDD7|nr:ATP-binding protein [Formosa haliotis]